MTDWPELAVEIAENILFPVADSVDVDGEIPASHFDALAADGFYGLTAPDSGVTPNVLVEVLETLCGGCLATTFTWMQHLGVLARLAGSENAAMKESCLPGLVAGEVRAGAAFTGAIPVPPTLWARRVDNGYVLDGVSPFVTGWGLVDVLQVSARDEFDDSVVHAILPATDAPGITAELLPLIAANGSNTVRLTFDGAEVPDASVSGIESSEEFGASQLFGLWMTSCLAMGVARRCIRELRDLGVDVEPLEEQAWRVRRDLDAALEESADLSEARACASELAVRAAAALVTATGSAALVGSNTAERLMREATFTMVAAGKPTIKTTLLARLSRS